MKKIMIITTLILVAIATTYYYEQPTTYVQPLTEITEPKKETCNHQCEFEREVEEQTNQVFEEYYEEDLEKDIEDYTKKALLEIQETTRNMELAALESARMDVLDAHKNTIISALNNSPYISTSTVATN